MNRLDLIAYAIKYQGAYDKIYQAIKNKEGIEHYQNIEALTILDTNYPKSLLDLSNPPFVLFYKGDISLINKDIIGIVGSRLASEYGKKTTNYIVSRIQSKYVVVSGLAKGIDAMAHESSIKNGSTIGVLGCGINYIYPKSNENLYQIMKKDHLIISEYPDLVSPMKHHFPFRNRIISALAKKLIVIEAKNNSGTLITVNESLTLNRDIYVVPHNIDSENGSGCNKLIQEGANILLTDDIDFL